MKAKSRLSFHLSWVILIPLKSWASFREVEHVCGIYWHKNKPHLQAPWVCSYHCALSLLEGNSEGLLSAPEVCSDISPEASSSHLSLQVTALIQRDSDQPCTTFQSHPHCFVRNFSIQAIQSSVPPLGGCSGPCNTQFHCSCCTLISYLLRLVSEIQDHVACYSA